MFSALRENKQAHKTRNALREFEIMTGLVIFISLIITRLNKPDGLYSYRFLRVQQSDFINIPKRLYCCFAH